MINMLTSETGCEFVIGQNGRILVKCPDKDMEEVAVLALKMIEREAHTTGLTDRVREFIRSEKAQRKGQQ